MVDMMKERSELMAKRVPTSSTSTSTSSSSTSSSSSSSSSSKSDDETKVRLREMEENFRKLETVRGLDARIMEVEVSKRILACSSVSYLLLKSAAAFFMCSIFTHFIIIFLVANCASSLFSFFLSSSFLSSSFLSFSSCPFSTLTLLSLLLLLSTLLFFFSSLFKSSYIYFLETNQTIESTTARSLNGTTRISIFFFVQWQW